ncbi:MAG TPA: serine/threonine-protein kinase, partial [Gemmataceae bacterium]|nr:serine/threonine-protein kinase [Gemmataceae bacterium]
DVKTTNILLRACDSSNTENYSSAAGTSALLPRLRDLDACLSDFGLAKQTRDDAGLTHTGAMVGTPGYMAPEQIRSQQATAAGDIFGLGAVLYECLTGQAPFRGATPFDALLLTLHQEPQRPRALNSRLHRDLETICLRCLEKEPQRRYASAAALAEDLELWLRGEPVRARPIGPLGRTWRRCRRYPLIAGLSLVLVLVAVAGISGIVYHWRAAEAARGEAETSNGDAEQLIGELIQNHAIAPLDALHMDFYRREPSIQALLKAESHCWRLWQKNPGDVSRRISLTNVLGALGTLYSARAEIAEAKRRFQQARDLWEPIVRERPANPEYRDWLATVLVWQARIETSQEHLMRSVQSIQEAHLLWQDLIEEQPENLAFLEKLGDCLQTMYSIIKTKRWRTSVKPLLEESHALLTRRLQQEPANRVIRKRLAQTCLLLNALRSQESAPQEAEAYLRQAYDHYKKLAESPGIDLQVRLSLGTCCYRLMGRQAQDPYYLEAVALFEETRKYLESQADQDPQQGWLQDAILRNGCSLALCHWKAGRSADAEKTYRNQVAALAAQARENPNAPLLTCQLLGTFSYLASALWELKLPAPALAIARDATVVAFAIGVPARDLGTRERHGWQLLSLAATLSHLEDPEEALRLAERARHISEDLCRELPLQPNFVSLLSGAWQRIGKARWALHQPDLALAAFREAASVQHRTFEAAPSAEARARLSNCYDRLYYWNTLRHTWSEAAAALLDREKLWLDNAEELMEVARDFQGLAEKMTEPRQQLSSAQERERQHYLAESARLSRAADALHDK